MTTQRKPLVESRDAPTAITTVYSASVPAIIDKFTGTNTTATAATLSVHLCKSGETAGATNRVAQAVSIAPGATYGFPEVAEHVLSVGGFLAVIASAAGITIRASGRETTPD